MKTPFVITLALASLLTVASCGPQYRGIEEGKGDSLPGLSDVYFKVHEPYDRDPPGCVAILPFSTSIDGATTLSDISIDQSETVRRALYAHLAPQGKRDIELARVDFVLQQRQEGAVSMDMPLGEALRCDAVISGQVTEYGSAFLGIYSRVAVGADLKMTRAADGTVLWEGKHVAESHGGSIPLSPVGLAMGILDAASNLQEETLLRVIDDLARRLVSTIPDNRIAVLEDPIAPKPPGPALTATPEGADTFVAALARRPLDVRKAELARAIKEVRFGDEAQGVLYAALVAADGRDVAVRTDYGEWLMTHGDYAGTFKQTELALAQKPEAPAVLFFLQGRALLKLDQTEAAEGAILKAVAFDGGNADYLNGLGYLNSLKGNDDRAIAAYRMAIDAKPANGFAYYNMGVTMYNLGDKVNAADSFYGAGLSYLKSGDYGQAEKALSDLKQMVAEGVDAQDAVDRLGGAIADLSQTGGI